MGSSFEKINLRIILLCKKFDIHLNVNHENISEPIYYFNNNDLGFIKIIVKTDKETRVESVTIYGTNEKLFIFANQLEKEKLFFGLEINNFFLSRINSHDSILNIAFDRDYINEFEKFNADSQLIYKRNIFAEKPASYIPHKTAYSKNYLFNQNPIILMSDKFYRPEHRFINFDEDEIADENGNINCLYCVNCKNCRNCIGCIGCSDCEECTNCIGCNECTRCYSSNYCNECDHCVDCSECERCSSCDSLIARSHMGVADPFNEILRRGIQEEYNFFPASGSTVYHEKIESFFLINHFVPYHRPYDNAENYKWNIQWRISNRKRRYWITEQVSTRYDNRGISLIELAKFLLMNKLQYRDWEFEMFVKEFYNIKELATKVSDSNELFDKILVPKKENSQLFYDEIVTKCPNECSYNSFLYEKYN